VRLTPLNPATLFVAFRRLCQSNLSVAVLEPAQFPLRTHTHLGHQTKGIHAEESVFDFAISGRDRDHAQLVTAGGGRTAGKSRAMGAGPFKRVTTLSPSTIAIDGQVDGGNAAWQRAGRLSARETRALAGASGLPRHLGKNSPCDDVPLVQDFLNECRTMLGLVARIMIIRFVSLRATAFRTEGVTCKRYHRLHKSPIHAVQSRASDNSPTVPGFGTVSRRFCRSTRRFLGFSTSRNAMPPSRTKVQQILRSGNIGDIADPHRYKKPFRDNSSLSLIAQGKFCFSTS